MIFFSSDHHFEHRNIISYCKRGYKTAEEMNEFLIEKWNSVVTNEDTVYYLGDFGLGPKPSLLALLARLNRRRIILVKGNHDKSDKAMLEIGFDEVHKYMDLKHQGKEIFLSHVPMVSSYHHATLCGHVHDVFKINGSIYNVGVDVNDYRPISFDEIPWDDLKLKNFYSIEKLPGEGQNDEGNGTSTDTGLDTLSPESTQGIGLEMDAT